MRDSQQEIIHFWFEETDPSLWFQVNETFDNHVRDLFAPTYALAKDGLCDGWKKDGEGCLALCLLLDQFPRNMFRGRPDAYATDEKALLTAKYAVSRGFDQLLSPPKRRFLYLPYQHSEKLPDQRKSAELFGRMAKDDPLGHEHALKQLRIIERFSRFPERNAALGRENSPEEEEYLAGRGGQA